MRTKYFAIAAAIAFSFQSVTAKPDDRLTETVTAVGAAIYLCDMPALYRLSMPVRFPDDARKLELMRDCATARGLGFSLEKTIDLPGGARIFAALHEALSIAERATPKIDGNYASFDVTLKDGSEVTLRFLRSSNGWVIVNL